MLKKMKLGTKISLMISGVLVVIFSVFIVTALTAAQNAITAPTSESLRQRAQANGLRVQEIFNIAKSTSADMSTYLTTAYQRELTQGSLLYQKVDNQSQIFPDLKLSALGKEIEMYMLSTASSAVVNSAEIVGIGAVFEPYKFATNKESYSFYAVNEGGTVKIAPYGEYRDYSQQSFYQNANLKKKLSFTEPYLDSKTNLHIITAATPIVVNSEVRGVVVVDISLDSFQVIAEQSKTYGSLYSTIMTDQGKIVYDTRSQDYIGKDMKDYYTSPDDAQSALASIQAGEEFSGSSLGGDGTEYQRFYYPITAGLENWTSLTGVASADVQSASRSMAVKLLLLAVCALVVIVLVVVVILRRTLRPIGTVVQAAQQIAAGNLDIAIECGVQDEIGMLACAFSQTIESLNTLIDDISRVLAALANNNLDVETSAEYNGSFAKIKNAVDNIILNLNHVISDINVASKQVTFGSEQVSKGAQGLSQGASEQAGAIDSLATTVDEISLEVKNNAENAQRANRISVEAGAHVEESNRYMGQMIEAMAEISAYSGKIGKIIKTIEDIAFQTNILALNAAVEAARAGMAGKGFAVVADEVRNLASKSAEAAKNTTELIGGSIRAVENGRRIVDLTAQAMLSVVDTASQVSSIVTEISAASEKQGASINRVTDEVEQISAVVLTNSATAEESAAAAEELSGQAQVLKNMVAQFVLREGTQPIHEPVTATVHEERGFAELQKY